MVIFHHGNLHRDTLTMDLRLPESHGSLETTDSTLIKKICNLVVVECQQREHQDCFFLVNFRYSGDYQI